MCVLQVPETSMPRAPIPGLLLAHGGWAGGGSAGTGAADGRWGLRQEGWAGPGSGSQGEALSELGAGGGPEDSRSLDPSLGPPPCGALHLLSAQHWGPFRLSCAGWVPGVATLLGLLPGEGNVCLLGLCATGASVVPPLRGCSMTQAPGLLLGRAAGCLSCLQAFQLGCSGVLGLAKLTGAKAMDQRGCVTSLRSHSNECELSFW